MLLDDICMLKCLWFIVHLCMVSSCLGSNIWHLTFYLMLNVPRRVVCDITNLWSSSYHPLRIFLNFSASYLDSRYLEKTVIRRNNSFSPLSFSLSLWRFTIIKFTVSLKHCRGCNASRRGWEKKREKMSKSEIETGHANGRGSSVWRAMEQRDRLLKERR